MNNATVFKLPADGPDPITDILDGWTVVDGAPTMKTWVLNTSADGSMISGLWEATPSTYRAIYDSFEFVHLVSGKLIIKPDGAPAVTLIGGDAFVVEPNFKGTWTIVETVRKQFTARMS